MKYVLLLMFVVVAYLVWDGFVPRQLTPSSLHGGARVVTDAEVSVDLDPLDRDWKYRKYIAVWVNNPTDMIVRSVTIAARIKLGEDTVVEVPGTKCVIAGSTDFRILAHTDADRQTCLVPLSREKSSMVPDKEGFHLPIEGVPSIVSGLKVVDDDKVKLDWWFDKATGHAQPIKLLSDAGDWIVAIFHWVAAPFQRVNK
jgi:hypothetical protein